MEYIKLIQQRLKLFGDPAVFVLNREGPVFKKSQTVNIKKYYNLETALTLNESLPYQLAFSPNGLLGKVNTVGQDVHHDKSNAEDYVAALVLDLDMDKTSYTDKQDYLNYITKKIESLHIKISFLTETGRGFHGYIFIREEDRYAVGKLLNGSKFKTLECKLTEFFEGGDKSSHSIVKLMRLPFSHYWKGYPVNLGEFVCKLYKFTRDSKENLIMENVTKPEQISLDGIETVGLAGIDSYLKSIQDELNKDISYESNNPADGVKFNETCADVNKLNITEVIGKLGNYPRNYKGNSYIFKIYNNNHIGFLMNGSGTLTTTDGYVVNLNENYVHCFSDSYHPIEERPRGGVYAFLYHYFKGDRGTLNKFLNDEYGITFSHKGDGAIETFLSFDADTGTFEFCSDGVWCSTKNKTKRIFLNPIQVKGRYETKYTLYGETEEANTYYVVNIGDKKTDFHIQPVFDRKKFNALYGSMGLATKASENELIDFWHGLSMLADEGKIPSYEYVYLNGYYPNIYVIGDKTFNKDADEIDVEPLRIILDTPQIETYNTTEDVTIKEFGAKFKELYSNRESMLMYVSFITLLLGHRFRVPALEQHITQVLVPGLFLSGRSQSGKTTAISICKHGFSLSTDSKKFSVKGATAQPINQASTDSWLLHLEEWTGKISEEKETIVRNILNKSTIARGLVSGENVFYNYRASVVIDGETSPSSESVVNRCIYIPFYKDERLGTVTLINSFSSLSYLKDFIKKLYQIDKDSIWDTYQAKQKLLMENGLTDRIANNYAYILCVNEWFDIYNEEDLLNAIRQNLELEKTVGESWNDLSSLLTELLVGEKIQATKDIVEEGEEFINRFIIPIPDELFQQNKTTIMGIIRRYSNKRIQKLGSNLVIKYDSNDTSDINKELYNIISLFIGRFRESYPLNIA